MRLICVSVLTLVFLPEAHAQNNLSPLPNIIEIGDGLSVETVPAKYITVAKQSDVPPPQKEWVIIPATFETVTETVIVQKADSTLEITPPVYGQDGTGVIPSSARVENVPAVIKQHSRRVVKTPARRVQRLVPVMCNLTRTERKLVKAESYIVRDETGGALKLFETSSEIADYINSR